MDGIFDGNESDYLTTNASTNASLYGSVAISAVADGVPRDAACERFQFVLNTVVTGVLCIVGVVGNTLSIAVLRRDRRNKVPSFLLQSQAVADNSLLAVSFLVLTIFVGLGSLPSVYVYLRFAMPYMKKYINPVGYMTKSFTIWSTVLLAINRYVAVCWPFAAERLLTLRRARIQVAVVAAVSVAVNLPRVFQYDVVAGAVDTRTNRTVPRLVVTDLGRDQVFTLVYFNALYTSLVLILPLVLLVGLDVLLIRQLRISGRRMALNTLGGTAATAGGGGNRSGGYSGQDRNITVVMLIVIFAVLVCHAPDRVIIVLRYLEPSDFRWYCAHPLVYASNISNVLIIVRSSVNFFILYVFRRRFRRTLRVRICPCACLRGGRCCGVAGGRGGDAYWAAAGAELDSYTDYDRKKSVTSDTSVLQHLNNITTNFDNRHIR